MTKEMNETARQRSNAAVKKNYVRAGGHATLGIKCRSNGSGASPNCRCRLLAVDVVPAVQKSKIDAEKGPNGKSLERLEMEQENDQNANAVEYRSSK